MQQPLPPDFSPFEPQESAPEAPASRRKSGLWALLLLVALIGAIAVMLNESVLQIHNVSVVGNQNVSWEAVVRAAGLQGNVGYFSVDEKKIAAGINQNRYLKFESLTKEFPDSLVIYVRERAICANVMVMGVPYSLDRDGMVLERGAASNQDVMLVTGFQAKEVSVGRRIVPGTAAQLSAYQALIDELYQQNFQNQVAELNLSDPDSLYLVTMDGYTVHLGDTQELRAKIGTVRGVVAKLRDMQRYGGVIEASVPAVATYTPAEM